MDSVVGKFVNLKNTKIKKKPFNLKGNGTEASNLVLDLV